MSETDVIHDVETDDPPTWWTKWRVPAAPVILGMTIVVAAVVFAFVQAGWDREAARRANCETQAEFRTFFTGYLRDQIGTPVDEIAGFDQLSPDAQEFAIQLAPIVEADRERDQQALAEYIASFPIPDCTTI